MKPDVEIKTADLDKIIKSLKKKIPSVRVGVLGAKDSRKEGNMNAKIGAIHEFGLDGMPARSFLRIPISEHLNAYMKASKVFTPELMKQFVTEESLRVFLAKIGIIAESIVDDAFQTGGFGQWPKSDMRRKTVKMTLVETQQLRRSIGSEVE